MHESYLILEFTVDSSLGFRSVVHVADCMLYFLVSLDGSTNITHLFFTKQNFAVQMAHKATVLPLTFLGSLSPPAISSLIVSLSSQTESTSPLISEVPLS